MKRFESAAAYQAALVAALACALPAQAQQRTPQPRVEDAHGPVYIVSSRATYEHGLRSLALDSSTRRDALGRELVLTRMRAHNISDLARHVHEKENRCGGFFAFDSKEQAEAFIRNDRSARALDARTFAVPVIDNGATVNPWLSAVMPPTTASESPIMPFDQLNRAMP